MKDPMILELERLAQSSVGHLRRRIVEIADLPDGTYRVISGKADSMGSETVCYNGTQLRKKWHRLKFNNYSVVSSLPENYFLVRLDDTRALAAKRLLWK